MKTNCQNCVHLKIIHGTCKLGHDRTFNKCEAFEPTAKAVRKDTKSMILRRVVKYLNARKIVLLKNRDEHTKARIELLDECIKEFESVV